MIAVTGPCIHSLTIRTHWTHFYSQRHSKHSVDQSLDGNEINDVTDDIRCFYSVRSYFFSYLKKDLTCGFTHDRHFGTRTLRYQDTSTPEHFGTRTRYNKYHCRSVRTDWHCSSDTSARSFGQVPNSPEGFSDSNSPIIIEWKKRLENWIETYC